MKIALIIINYRDYATKYLVECRDSLRQINFTSAEYQVYLVDNDATPDTEKFIKETMPEAIYVPTASNLGWGGGNNAGIKAAIADGCDYFFLLNMDITVEPNFLSEALSVIDTDSEIGLVQSRLMLYSDKNKINSIGNAAHFLGFGYCNGYQDAFAETAASHEITYASGAALLLKRSTLDKIGPLTEEFFMYQDDLEWGMKARLAGLKNVIANKSVVYHKYQFSRWTGKFYYLERNRLILWFMLLKWPTLILLAPAALLMELGLILISLKNHWFVHKIKSYLWFLSLKNWRHLLAWRRATQKIRVISDQELTRDWTGRVKYQDNIINEGLLMKVGNAFFNAYWQIVRRLIVW